MAFEDGGGLKSEGGDCRVADCVFEFNRAPFGSGGGASFRLASGWVDRCVFRYNEAGFGGGVASTIASPVTMTDCLFLRNTASDGGAVHASFYDEGDGPRSTGFGAKLTGCTLVENMASHGSAIACVRFGYTTLTSCTLYGNVSLLAPDGAIHVSTEAQVRIDRTIVAFSQVGSAVYCAPGAPAYIGIGCSDLHGNQGGDWTDCAAGWQGLEGNLGLDPLFCNAAGGDYTLNANSPCSPGSSPPGCDLIGAWPVGCGATAVAPITWGAIKGRYRDQ
jgi:hypothetical protein